MLFATGIGRALLAPPAQELVYLQFTVSLPTK